MPSGSPLQAHVGSMAKNGRTMRSFGFFTKVLLTYCVCLTIWGLFTFPYPWSATISSQDWKTSSHIWPRWREVSFKKTVKDSRLEPNLDGGEQENLIMEALASRGGKFSWIYSEEVTVKRLFGWGSAAEDTPVLQSKSEGPGMTRRRRLGAKSEPHRSYSPGRQWESPWGTQHKSSVLGIPECERLHLAPREFYESPHLDLKDPIRELEDFQRPGLRTFAVQSNGGVGNSLRGYMSAWVYSLLSGRRIVLINYTYPHREVFGDLYSAMNILPDIVPVTKKVGRNLGFDMDPPPQHVPRGRSHPEIIQSLAWSTPLVHTSASIYWDDYWYTNSSIRQCVLKATACEDEWCVHSRALRHLFRTGLKEPLRDAAKRILLFKPKVNTDTKKEDVMLPGMEMDFRFDYGLHVRTLPPKLEYRNITVDECPNLSCVRVFEWSQNLVNEWREPSTWRCLGDLLSGGPLRGPPLKWTFLEIPHKWPGRDHNNITREESSKETPLTNEGEAAERVDNEDNGLMSALRKIGEGKAQAGPSEDRGWEESVGEKEGGARPRWEGPAVNIFLATDNEEFRGELVERLRQFGNVFYQDLPAVHTSHDQMDLDRMPTMVDFFSLMQADVQLGLTAYLSSFSESAALISNATLMYLNNKNCSFEVRHHIPSENNIELLHESAR